MLNLGNITDARMESIRISGETAAKSSIPIALDAVGIACSRLRRSYLHKLLSVITPAVIKGNYSEINALFQDSYCASGVDADASLDTATIDRCAVALARERNSIILASGKVDILTDGQRLVHLYNGTPQLSNVTGTGCMLGALCAAFLSADQSLNAVIAACAMMGIAGEKARTSRGSGTFFVNLMDALSTMTAEEICTNIKLEEISIENI
jgi:hydroxyethylthiazole kinase